MLESINAVFIRTSNMENSIKFYQNLGVDLKVSNHGGGTHAEADFGGVHFAIQPWKSHAKPTSNVSFSFHVPNLEEYCRTLTVKGLKFESLPSPQPFGGVTAEIYDPDGNHIFFNTLAD